ncbi:MAG: hypothetical protein QMD61_05765 [Methanobacterium sp.]|nr:hypothetical protein [Methanobacterium sp.]
MIQRILEAAPPMANNRPEGSSFGPNGFQNPPEMNFVDIGTYIAIIIGVANICLLLALLSIYLKNYKQIKSKFTTGLLVFTSLLLLQNMITTLFLALNVVFNITSQGLEIGRPQTPLSSVNIIQFIALLILLRITWD